MEALTNSLTTTPPFLNFGSGPQNHTPKFCAKLTPCLPNRPALTCPPSPSTVPVTVLGSAHAPNSRATRRGGALSRATSALTPRASGLAPLTLPSSFLGWTPGFGSEKHGRGTAQPDALGTGGVVPGWGKCWVRGLQSLPFGRPVLPCRRGREACCPPPPARLPPSGGGGGEAGGATWLWRAPPGGSPNADLQAEGGNGGLLPPARVVQNIGCRRVP